MLNVPGTKSKVHERKIKAQDERTGAIIITSTCGEFKINSHVK